MRQTIRTSVMAVALGIVGILSLLSPALGADIAGSTITFDNQSGQPALVKLVGPLTLSVEVPDGGKQTVPASGGHYFILTRYGTDESSYRYSKGDHFDITETITAYSHRYQRVRITLHAVINGKYHTSRSNKQEFDNAGAAIVAGQ
jgi:hypothetical protein